MPEPENPMDPHPLGGRNRDWVTCTECGSDVCVDGLSDPSLVSIADQLLAALGNPTKISEGPIAGTPIQVALGSEVPEPGMDMKMVTIIGHTVANGHSQWVSDHGMMWSRGISDGIRNPPGLLDHPPNPREVIRGRWDMTAAVDAALTKHFEGVEPLSAAVVAAAEERGRGHFDPRAVAKGMFPTHIGPGGAHYSDGTILSPSVVEDFDRFRQVADARALLRANDWVEGDPGEWFPASSLRSPSRASTWAGEAWAINVDMCSPAILRALAILSEEAQS